MLQIITGISRVPSKSKQTILTVSRSYCYKPVERKIGASTLDQILNQKKGRRKWVRVEASDPNLIAHKTKAADNGRSLKLIESLPQDPILFTENDLIDAFAKLSSGPVSDDALLHDNFNTFIEATTLILPKLSATQNVQIFSQMCRAEIPMFDELADIVVKALLQRITFMTIDEIIEVDRSIRSYYVREWKISKLLETLRQSTRTAFIVKVNCDLIESQSYEKLMRIIQYLSNNKSLVKNIDTTSLAEQLLLIDDHKFQLNDVVCVIITLARNLQLDEHSQQLLTKMFRIWCSRNKNIGDVQTILELLVTKKLKDIDLTPFQNLSFIQHCAKHAIDHREIRSAFDILNRFNEMNFVSTELIDYLSKAFNSEKYRRLKIDDYATLCTACEKANHKPANWSSKIVPAIQRAEIQNTNFYNQVDLAITMSKLGIYHAAFTENLLKSAEIQILYKNDTRLDEIHKTYINNNDDAMKSKTTPANGLNTYLSWLTLDLEKFVGTNKVLNNVPVSDNLTIPLAIKVNTKTGQFVKMQEKTIEQNLICNEDELIIGVITQDVGAINDDFESVAEMINEQRKLIKEKGWLAITLDEGLYGSMQTYKRAFTFFKIIVYAINNRK